MLRETPGYYSEIFNGNLSGPIGKKASFFFTVQQRDIDNVSVVVAQVLGPGSIVTPYNASVPSPSKRLNISPRVDFQLSPSNTLTVRYQYARIPRDNDGIGEFSLPSHGYNSHSTENTVQISDTQIISPTIVNETRFQYIRDSDTQIPLSIEPTIIVQGAFTGGGSSQGTVDQQSGPLRAAELHLHRARQALHQVRRKTARHAVLQQPELRLQRLVYFFDQRYQTLKMR